MSSKDKDSKSKKISKESKSGSSGDKTPTDSKGIETPEPRKSRSRSPRRGRKQSRSRSRSRHGRSSPSKIREKKSKSKSPERSESKNGSTVTAITSSQRSKTEYGQIIETLDSRSSLPYYSCSFGSGMRRYLNECKELEKAQCFTHLMEILNKCPEFVDWELKTTSSGIFRVYAGPREEYVIEKKTYTFIKAP